MPLLALLAIAGSGAAAGADVADAQLRQQRRREIENMTDAQRSRLRTKCAAFRKLPADEQEKLRQLDRELKEDRRQQGGELTHVMSDYIEWLETLDAGQRQDLRTEATPDSRERHVRRIINEQHERAELMASRRGSNRGGLSPADLDTVLGVVEKHLREKGPRSSPQLEELKTKQGLQRHAAIWEMAFGRRSGERGRVPALLFPPSEQLIDEMLEQIGNADQKRMASRRDPQQRAAALFSLISRGLWAEFESIKPDEATLASYLAELSGEQQGEILRLPPEGQQRELLRRYMEAHPETYPRPPRVERWFDGGGSERRPFWRGGGPGRGPDRREQLPPDARPNGRPPERPPEKPESEPPAAAE
jgi:hypothetical protein